MDCGEILMMYNKKSREKKNLEDLKKNVKLLKRKKDALEERENRLREDINSGSVGEARGYSLPLSVTETDPSSPKLTQPPLVDVTYLMETAKNKQKLQCHAITTGVTAWKSENESDQEIRFTFDPCVMGTFYGPYTLRMKPLKGRMFLRGHTLPHSVPVKDLYSKFFERSQESYQSTQLAPFLEEVMRYTRAYLSRQHQFQELRVNFRDDLREFQSVSHHTAVSFILDLKDEGSSGHVTATIAINYDRDGERPRPGSLKVSLAGQEMTQDDRDAFDDQCAVFYTHRLSEAVYTAF